MSWLRPCARPITGHPVGRVVIDSLSELAFAAREEERFAAYMRSLVGLVRAGGSSLLLTSETSVHGLPGNSLEGLLFLFDNTIDLRYIEEGSADRPGRARRQDAQQRARHDTEQRHHHRSRPGNREPYSKA